MTIKSVVCTLIAFTFFACDDSPTKSHYPVIVHTLQSDSYDSGGNISIFDSRLKKIHHYTVVLVITQKGEDPLEKIGHTIADSLTPDQQFFQDMDGRNDGSKRPWTLLFLSPKASFALPTPIGQF